MTAICEDGGGVEVFADLAAEEGVEGGQRGEGGWEPVGGVGEGG